jgi:hypothetical protein
VSQSASFTAIQTPFVDPKTGKVTQVWLYVLQQWQKQLAKGFDSGDTEQGAVILAAGSVGHTLGSAAMEAASAFDPHGAAAAAQTAAEAHADAVAATAQSNAEGFASNASNITSGNLALGRLPAVGLTVTITTAALTPTGTQGSQTFTNGVLTAQVQAT